MPQPDLRAQRDTKERILDSATRLFAEQGFDATSLRGITSDADVNLAAVNYHFGSKEALIQAVFEKLLGPINRARLERLDAIESDAHPAPPPVEQIIEAFARPVLALTWGDPGRPLKRLLAHTIGQPNAQIRHAFVEQFGEIVRRFSRSLQLALPELGDEEVRWRILFMAGAMVHTVTLGDDMPGICGTVETADPETIVRRLVPFVSAGMRAPETGGA